MNRTQKRLLLPSLVATSLLSATLFSVKPASANDHLLRDIGVGAGASVVTGTISGHHSVINNAINGAAAGAAVHGTSRALHSRNLARDAGVGAATSTVTGEITGSHHPLHNALSGAAAGAAIALLGR